MRMEVVGVSLDETVLHPPDECGFMDAEARCGLRFGQHSSASQSGLPQDLGSGSHGYWWEWVVRWPELLPEAGTKSAVIDSATNLKQQIGATS